MSTCTLVPVWYKLLCILVFLNTLYSTFCTVYSSIIIVLITLCWIIISIYRNHNITNISCIILLGNYKQGGKHREIHTETQANKQPNKQINDAHPKKCTDTVCAYGFVSLFIFFLGFSLSRLLELTLSFPLNTFHLNLIETYFGPTCYRTDVMVSVSNSPPELDRGTFWFHILVPPATGPMPRWVSAIFHLNLIETHFGPTCYSTIAMVSVSNIRPELDTVVKTHFSSF